MPSRPSWLYQGDFCVCKKVLLLIEIKTQTLAKCVDLSTCEFDIVIKLTSPIQRHSPLPPSIKLTHPSNHLYTLTHPFMHTQTPGTTSHTSTPSLTCTPTHPPHHFLTDLHTYPPTIPPHRSLICTPPHLHIHPITDLYTYPPHRSDLPTYPPTCPPHH